MKNGLKLRQVTPKDEALLFNWANDPDVRYQAINQQEITIDEHRKWISLRLNDPNTMMWILEDDGIPAGQIRWDLKGKEAMLDYSISRDYRGRGLGVELLRISIEEVYDIWTDISLIAEVKEKNIASCKVIIAAGFEQINSNRFGYLRYKFKL